MIHFSLKLVISTLAIAVAAASPANAQTSADIDRGPASQQSEEPDQPSQGENEIVVQGYTKKEVRNFLWRSMIETNGSIAKKIVPVCIGIDNAPDGIKQPLLDRMHKGLDDFGIEIGEDGCDVNSVVVFYPEAKAFVNWLDENHNQVFDSLYKPEKRRLIRPDRAAYTWHALDTREEDIGVEKFFARLSGGQTSGFDSPGGRALPVDAINSTLSFTIMSTGAINELTIEQVADYLIMQMLVEFRPDIRSEVPNDSILRLFDGNQSNPDAGSEMSQLDRSIITELYASKRSNFRSGAIRQAIARASISSLESDDLILASEK